MTPSPNGREQENIRVKSTASWRSRFASISGRSLRLVRVAAVTIRQFEDSLGFLGRVLRRFRQTAVISAICAAPLYILVSIGSVSGDDVRSLLEIVEIEGASAPPQTMLYRVDANTGKARALPQCENEYIAKHFTPSTYGSNVIIINVFGEKIAPLLLTTEWVLSIFFNISLPTAVQTYLDMIKDPSFSRNAVGNVTEYIMDNQTNVKLMKEILAEPSFIEACADQIVRRIADGEYICQVTRMVVTNNAVMGAGFSNLCLASTHDSRPRIKPKSEAGFWTSVKTRLGIFEIH